MIDDEIIVDFSEDPKTGDFTASAAGISARGKTVHLALIAWCERMGIPTPPPPPNTIMIRRAA